MFTGLISEVGTVAQVRQGPMWDVWVDSSLAATGEPLVLGESIACDGVCLTVVAAQGSRFQVQVAPETLRRSTANGWVVGRRLNLERALKVGDRLGGHWVQGHVDAVVQVIDATSDGGSWAMRFALPPELAPFLVEKGSICLDGVSLTLTEASHTTFAVMLIPETRQRTALGSKGPGAHVNVEVDVVGKYVARMLGPRSGLTAAQVAAAGFSVR
jgi:riboflavin synthase